MSEPVIVAEGLSKTFVFGLLRKKVAAVKSVSFAVEKGEIFGFLGPNGAGKTTTIKMLMGLIYPTAGRCELLGRRVPDVTARRRLGFVPESPYFYEFLTGSELMDLMGRLFELPAHVRRERGKALLAQVGLERAATLPLRKYSKGMMQRIGLAQALLNDPELVVLDEPMSGLDPVGRKEIRDLIVSLRHQGKTVFFSTHILSDAELICDRCGIMVDGELRDIGKLDQLLSPRLLHTEVVLEQGGRIESRRIGPDESVDAALSAAIAAGAHVVSVTPRRERLEDLFVREVHAHAARRLATAPPEAD